MRSALIARVAALTGLLALGCVQAGHAGVAAGPLDADAAGIRVTLDLPQGVALLPGSAALVFTLTDPTTGTAHQAKDALAAEASAVAGHFELRLADPAAAQLPAVQATGRGFAAAGNEPETAVEVAFAPCLTTPVAATDRPVTLSIRFAPDGPPLSLLPTDTTLAALLRVRGLMLEACP